MRSADPTASSPGSRCSTVLADLAEDGPLLCLVDDAQWLDQATAEALLFAARRLAAEGVAIVLAGRDDGFVAPGIPDLQLSRLNFEDSSRPLADRGRAPALRSQIITELAGQPARAHRVRLRTA
ncbi:hypothetical protein SMICM304S_02335 [Streptomyces microflavus]